MFKNDKEPFAQEAETVIAPSVRVEGDFVSEGNIRVEGAVTGSVDTKQDLLVGRDAEITASVTARNATISGTLHGDLKVEDQLELTETARIDGDIEAKVLTVAPGATLQGKLNIGGAEKDVPVAVVQEEEAPKEVAEEAPKAKSKTKSERAKKIEAVLQQ